MRRRVSCCGLLLLVLGCGRPPQMAPENRRIMQGLQTAVSSRKVEWLEEVVKLMEAKHSAGDMSEDEYKALQKIVEKARAGDWAGAQRDAFALTEAQRPTAVDLEKIKPGAKNDEQ